MRRFENKVALVTGGAFGMGAATAKLFALEGAKVVIADLLEDEASKRINEITELGGEAIYIELDVTKEDNWESIIEKLIVRMAVLTFSLITLASVAVVIKTKATLRHGKT